MVEALPAEVYFKGAMLLNVHFVTIFGRDGHKFPVGVGLGHALSDERPEALERAIKNAWHLINQDQANYKPCGVEEIPGYAVLCADKNSTRGVSVRYLQEPEDGRTMHFDHFDEGAAITMLAWYQRNDLSRAT